MNVINRWAVSLKPKQPFLDWLCTVPEPDSLKITLEELRSDTTLFLIPENDDSEDGLAFVEDHFAVFFEESLSAWYTDKNLWPHTRDLATFRKWFDVDIHDLVVDIDDTPLEKEEL